MKVVIIEDEIHNARLLSGMINKLRPDWEIIETFESVSSTVSWLKENDEPDLYFMDIQLTDGICFSIFDQVEVKNHIIFTTAYNEYAIQAFKVNSVDYLLKPLKEEKLLNAIEKYEQLTSVEEKQVVEPVYTNILDAIKNSQMTYRKRFLVAGSTSFFKLDVSEIAYFYSENRTTFAVTYKGKEHVLNHTLEKIEEQLNPDIFFRANRAIILSCDSVRKIENYFGGKLIVRLIHPFDEPITISRLKANAIKEWLDK